MELLFVGGRTTCLYVILGLLLATAGSGCGGGVFVASTDGGSDEAGPSPTSDAGSGCKPADCAGLAATTEAKICPGGTSVGRTVCASQPHGQCGWDFPACPAVDAAGPCQCSGPAPGAPSVRCADGSIGGPVCTTRSDGTCSWQVRSCPGLVCPGLGCNPSCPNGVLKDGNGCDTCICAPVADAGDSTSCQTDADCAGGRICGFRETDGCSAGGSCFPSPGAVCLAYSPGCACDGTEITIVCTGLPSGYVSKPLRHAGVCGRTDAGGN